MTKARLVVPQMVILVSELGVYILSTFALAIISVTGAKVTWMELSVVLFFAFFTW